MASVSSRYARAFADVVIDRKFDLSQVREELSSIVEAIKSSDELRRVWESPAIKHDQKLAILDALSARMGLVSPVRNFIAILIDHGRIPMLQQIAKQVETELNQRLGIAVAEVVSARELSGDEKRAIELQVARITGKHVRAQYATDAGVLGGAVVRVGSTIYDGSVRGQLQRIREQLTAE